MEEIKWAANKMPKSDDQYLATMSLETVEKVIKFHQGFPQYTVTPLASLPKLAATLGVAGIYVKDESYRFGLNAFKVLGGSFAIGSYIAQQLGRDVTQLSYDYLTSDKLQKDFPQTTFFTATDGNHGRGVAWSANKLGQKAVVRMPKGTVATRIENIRREGAEVTIEDKIYDDCVRMAAAEAAASPRGVVVQDTAWEGYEEIPTWIMQGYGTMALESTEQLKKLGVNRPTHIFIQAGVGSLAGAIQGYFANLFPGNCPITTVVEATAADCLYKGAVAGDGEPRNTDGNLQTMMAGLACGEPNTISWDILRNHSAAFVVCPDWVSANGMRMLGAPQKGDPQVVSGESGAVGPGLLAAIMTDERYVELRKAIKLDSDSHVLFFSTEGDTDPVNYRKVVWGGACTNIE